MEALKARGIGTGIHFIATHLHPWYRQRWPDLSLPDSEWNSARICSIPLFPDLGLRGRGAGGSGHRGRSRRARMKPYAVNRLSVVIPVYNEEDSLPELLQRTRAACEQLPCSFEIILVDDGSRDRSAELLQEAAAEPGSPVVAVILNRNYGQHAAIMAGFEQCTGRPRDHAGRRPAEPARGDSRVWSRSPPRATTSSARCASGARTRPCGGCRPG